MSVGQTVYGLVKITMNSPVGGQTETYYSESNNVDLLVSQADIIARIRLHLLATNCTMINVVAGTHSSNIGTRIKRVNLTNTPFPANGKAVDLSSLTNQPTNTNVSADAIQVTFQNAVQAEPLKNSNRSLRMIPDLYIAGDGFFASGFNGATYPPSNWGGTPQRAVGDGFTAFDYLTAWMEYVATHFSSKRVAARAAPVPPKTIGKAIEWDIIPYASAAVVRPHTRRVGRPIGPFAGRRA